MIDKKENVSQFNHDVYSSGKYEYSGDRVSSKIANSKIDSFFQNNYDFLNQTVLDCGCGDGTYSYQYLEYGASFVLGVDPAENAVQIASMKYEERFPGRIKFIAGNIFDIEKICSDNSVPYPDVTVLRGVIHHLSEPAHGLSVIGKISKNILIMEPNGSNPILKIIEKTSQYHIDHEEQSFSLSEIKEWLSDAGFKNIKHRYINLVPFFCPDWFARLADFLTPLIERIPVLRRFACGQIMFLASK